MTEVYHFTRKSRSGQAVAILLTIYGALLAAYLLIAAHPALLAIVVLLTLPAVLDIARNRQSSLAITGSDIHWASGSRIGSMPLREIEKVRMDTRLDLSRRMTLKLRYNRSLRLPLDVVPPRAELAEALASRGIPLEQHHFYLTG